MIITILSAIALLILAFAYTVTLEGIARKIEARIHRRCGPPFWQNFIDIFKSLTKHSISHGFIFDFGVLMALGGTMGQEISSSSQVLTTSSLLSICWL